jgi:uncharacterized protein YjiS (DUF1127 family)
MAGLFAALTTAMMKLSGFIDKADRWLDRRRAERLLRSWPEHMLKDIGIDKSDIAHVTAHGRPPRRQG